MMRPVRAAVMLYALALAFAPEPAAASAAKGGAARKQPAVCDRAAFRVAIDVGHTPEEPGAMSARGVSEYDFNLRLAAEIERKLREAGYAKAILLVTSGKALPGLVQRVARANASGADLLLSVHHDSVPEMFLQDWEHEGQPRRFSDRFRGHSLFVSGENGDLRGSLQFGALLGAQLKARSLQYTPHYTEPFMGGRRRTLVDAEAGVYRFDRLYVLRAAHMPAVLFEAGSIVNRDEELLLNAPEHRALLATAAADAVDAFCTARAGDRVRAARRQGEAPAAGPQARSATPDSASGSRRR